MYNKRHVNFIPSTHEPNLLVNCSIHAKSTALARKRIVTIKGNKICSFELAAEIQKWRSKNLTFDRNDPFKVMKK